ncbi:MAG TPA: hypothetical protein VN703_00140, partial [Candidatus Sulfopaludibacter sp.]|nr:hypothetical protein [Candidatus Sulfopaludibacter sp.]
SNISKSNIINYIVIKVNQTDYQFIGFQPLEKPKLVQTIKIPIKDGNFSYNRITGDTGKYIVSFYLPNETQALYNVSIKVINPFLTLTSLFFSFALLFFIALTIISLRAVGSEDEGKGNVSNGDVSNENKGNEDIFYEDEGNEINLQLTKYKILRFVFISGMVFSVIAGLIFSEVEIGSNSPAGLILKQVSDKNGNLATDSNTGLPIKEWVINIGGKTVGNYSSFIINIPFFVVLLGLIGGYLRYLSKAASKVYLDRTLEYYEEKTSSEFAVVTQAELSEIALSPLLASVVWLLISQGQTTFSVYTLAAVSFSIGLVTREIMNAIKKFMNTINLSKDS